MKHTEFNQNMQRRRILSEFFHSKIIRKNQNFRFNNEKTLIVGVEEEGDDHVYVDVPTPRRMKSERKPYSTPMKVLIQRAKEERETRRVQPCRMIEEPPDNGLLVPELVNVAHRVYRARHSLLHGISKLVDVIPIQRCRYCFEVHIGHVGHEVRTCSGPNSGFRSATHVWGRGGVQDVVYFPKCFHLYDRVGKPRIGHDERCSIRKIHAIVELCIQDGLDLDKFPTRRRTKPVYCIEGRIADFEPETENNETKRNLDSKDCNFKEKVDSVKKDEMLGSFNEGMSLREISIVTLESWFEMIRGADKIMEKYTVHTCGYCPEVQVGPKGHKVRMCKAAKHQSRNGLHAWQEATIDDLVGPNYVWHVVDLRGPAYDNKLKRYYGKATAVVELCVQGGAPVPDEYRSMMRIDVVPPDRDEVDLVA